MTYVITQSCCSDATCVEVCPVDCIHPRPDARGFEGAEMLHIDPRACVDCGACFDVCPVGAVVADHEMSAPDAVYLDMAKDYFAGFDRLVASATVPERPPLVPISESLRVAIVGTGPAGCYAALELLRTEGIDVQISMFDRSPAFGGLVRHGVAPDHPSTKAIAEHFERNLPERSVEMFLNVAIGEHLSHRELLEAHHAVIYAVGASEGRPLDIPGEELPESCTAAEFVGWYNGHADHSDRRFDLSATRAIVVGNGNVALDVARILALPTEALERTDIAEHARIALASSRIEEIMVVGRRGPMETAATTPELIALSALSEVDVLVAGGLRTGAAVVPSTITRKADLLADFAARAPRGGRRIIFKYFRSPLAILGAARVEAISLRINDDRRSREERTEVIDCGLVIAAVGHRGTAVSGLPFDQALGIMPNRAGRVTDAESAYVTGWAKRGPTGVIGTNRRCAAETVGNLVADFCGRRLQRPTIKLEMFRKQVSEQQPAWIDRAGWHSIDRAERRVAKGSERGRRKLVDLESLLAAASGLA